MALSRAVWLKGGELHVVFDEIDTLVGLSGDATRAVVRKGDEEDRRYLTALCSVQHDMQLVGAALRLRNHHPPPGASKPYLCRTLLPQGTPLLRSSAAPLPHSVSWVGCSRVQADDGTVNVAALGEVAQLTLFPSKAGYQVEYLAEVRDPATDKAVMKYSPGFHISDLLRPPKVEVRYAVVREVRCVGDATPWDTPLSVALGLISPAAATGDTPLPVSLPLLGSECPSAYPTLFPRSCYKSGNLFRGVPAPSAPCMAYEARLAAVFTPSAALVLHDLSTLAVHTEDGDSEYFVHHQPDGSAKSVLAGDRTVRLPAASPFTGGRQYHLRDLMLYLAACRAEAREPWSAGPLAAAPSVNRQYTIPEVGDLNLVGTKASFRFEDRCILRMDVQGTTADLLLPNGQSVTVSTESYSLPAHIKRYVDSAVAHIQLILNLEASTSKQ